VDDVGDELRRAYERVIVSFSTGNTDALDELLDDDILDHNPMPDQAPGREGFKHWLSQARSAFPDLSAQVEGTLAEGDLVAGRVTYRGTHRGEFLGIPATDRPVEFEAFHMVRFAGRRIVEWWAQPTCLAH
jgi:steroid delta-isomerase-like uncharacterized protein